jgi:DNA modification methylase
MEIFKTGHAVDSIASIDPMIQSWIFDPPYNVGFSYEAGVNDSLPREEYEGLIREACRAMFEKTQEGGSMFLIHYKIPAARLMPIIESVGWTLHQWVSWVYPHNMGMSSKRFTQGSRAVLWFSKGDPKVNIKAVKGQYKNPNDKRIRERIAQGHAPALMDWWAINLRKNVSKGHRGYANSLPPELVRRCLLTTTDSGDWVGDCMAGSGTTFEVAREHGLNCFLNDLNPEGVSIWRSIE